MRNGQAGSPWLEADSTPPRAPLSADAQADVAVLGAGIVGVTAALLLARHGAEVILLEASRVGAGVTGHTTAKLTSLHGLTYERLRRRHGLEAAAAYGAANEQGIATVARLVEELELDCDLRRRPNFTYGEDPDQIESLEAEVEAAGAAGLPASYTEDVDLPFPIAGAVRLEDQAEFHPHRYLQGITRAAESSGAQVYEHSRAVALGNGSVRLESGAAVRAGRVLVATHIPFADRGLWFARTHPERSYLLALRIRGETPGGMYLSAGSPTRSVRSHPLHGSEHLLVGGESHRPGVGDETERYEALERWARRYWQVEEVEYRWSAQDNMPVDGLPFIGRLWPLSDWALCATGFRKWGLAMGTTAGAMLAEIALGQRPALADAFRTERLNLMTSARELVTHNAASGLHFFADRLTRRARAGQLAPGEGRVVGSGLGQAALYRDDDGRLHALSARCTHLGCIVRWNQAERSWDCPCHGSRFGTGGEVLQGPAVSPLSPARLPH